MNDGEYTDSKVYVKGIVSSIKNTSGIAQYGNIDFYISDDGKDETHFLVFQSLYLGGAKFTSEDQLKVGDEVVIYGKLTNYMGNTPETEGKGQTFIYSLNGKGGDPVDKPGIDDKDAIYANNFDKEKAEKTYGSGSSWPFLDQFEGWKNEKGTGVSAVEYEFKGMSARSNSESDGSYSEYAGSGVNNLFFGAAAHFEIKNIALGSVQNLSLKFGAEKYAQDSKLFNHDEFKVYVSNDRSKWVSLDYAFEAGDPEGVWRIASTVFTVPAGTESLCIYISASVASAYRIDDIVLSPSETAGTEIDFSKGEDLGTGGGDEPEVKEPVVVTVAEFLAAAESNNQPYTLTGVISGSVNEQYGNFDLVDETGTVYVYGLTKTNLGYGTKNDLSYKELGLKKGDTVTLTGFRGSYTDKEGNKKDEVVYAYYVDHKPGEGGGDEPGEVGEYESNLTWTSVDGGYPTDKANINGNEGITVLKLGTGKKFGKAKATLPAGTAKLSFFGIAWKGTTASVKFTIGTEEYTYDLAGNEGAANSSPYTVTLSEDEHFVIELPEALAADTDVTVETYQGTNKGYRAIIIGSKAE